MKYAENQLQLKSPENWTLL